MATYKRHELNEPGAMFLTDFYKLCHGKQYPRRTTQIYETWTPRMSRITGIDSVVCVGFQPFIIKYLMVYFDKHFFQKDIEKVCTEYTNFCILHFSDFYPETEHIRKLHALQYLPLRIKCVPEGTQVPIKCPMATVTNTHPDFAWLVGYLETLMSCNIWFPCTAATIAKRARTILEPYVEETCEDGFDVANLASDFSMRGHTSLESSELSCAAHLLSFNGTASIPAIFWLKEFYGADPSKEIIGRGTISTEHSVMCAYDIPELDVYKHLMTQVHPKGKLSIVSDSYDFWNVIENILPRLKDLILVRDGKIIIRPDSGNPVLILCGDPQSENQFIQRGLIECLWDLFGGQINSKGYKELNPHIGAIYGDSINLINAPLIAEGLKQKGFAVSNVVFGFGSYNYQYVTRDTFGFALKTTFGVIDGKPRAIYKDPKTDTGNFKKSQRGMVAVYKNDDGKISWGDGILDPERAEEGILQTIFEDGVGYNFQTLSEIRRTLHNVTMPT